MHLVQNSIRKTKGNLEELSKQGKLHERNLCAPSPEKEPREENSLQEDCDSKAAWNAARKRKLKPNIKRRLFSCEGARDTEDRMLIVYSFCSMSKENWA